MEFHTKNQGPWRQAYAALRSTTSSARGEKVCCSDCHRDCGTPHRERAQLLEGAFTEALAKARHALLRTGPGKRLATVHVGEVP